MPTLLGNKREGTASARQGSDGYVVYEEQIHYLVQADYAGQPQRDILATNGLPQVNQSLIGSLMCSSAQAKMRTGNVLLYDVDITFSSQVSENTDPQTPQQGDPTSWVPVADVTFEPYTEVVRQDINGKAWVNSANKPFEIGLEIPRRIASVTFTQFESLATTVDAIIDDRCDHVNSTTYRGKAKKTLLCTVDRATVGFFYGVRCWSIQYTLKYKPTPPLPNKPNSGGWTVQQLDAGWHYDDAGTLTAFTDDAGTQFVGLLDGEGDKLADQENDDPVFLPFDMYEEANFNTFLRW